MKKIFQISLLLIASLALMLTSCKKDEIVFDHEKPQFELKADAILMEVIVPAGTAAKEEIYLVGPFNGMDTLNFENPLFKLTKAAKNDSKFGIYLYPDEFVDGKTLADGFWFVSAKQGLEKGSPMHIIEGAQLGVRYDQSIVAWAGAKEEPEIEHDGFVVYVLNETGWDDLALYAWGSGLPDLFGSWPGAQPTGKEKVDGVEYIYFDCGEANTGLTYNLIFNNNNNGSQLADFGYTIDHNVFLKITAEGVEELGEPGEKFPTFEHDGDAIFVCNMAGWDEVALYAWSATDPELFGGWPGAQPKEQFEFKGYDWYLFDCGAENAGKFYNFIANNNGGGKQVEPLCAYELTTDGIKYIIIRDDLSAEEIEDPNTYDFGDAPGPGPKPEPEKVLIDIYVYDATTAAFTMEGGEETPASFYAWGSSQIFGEWPGKLLSEWEDVTILGMPLKKYSIECEEGSNYNLILNNKATTGNKQYDAFAVTAEGELTEVYYKLTDTIATPLQVTPLAPRRK